jgi:hypothetical protein
MHIYGTGSSFVRILPEEFQSQSTLYNLKKSYIAARSGFSPVTRPNIENKKSKKNDIFTGPPPVEYTLSFCLVEEKKTLVQIHILIFVFLFLSYFFLFYQAHR